jgi:hypothetical protein
VKIVYSGSDPFIQSFIQVQTWIRAEYYDIPLCPILDESQKVTLHKVPPSKFKRLVVWAEGHTLSWLKKHAKRDGFSQREAVLAFQWTQEMYKLPRDQWVSRAYEIWERVNEML